MERKKFLKLKIKAQKSKIKFLIKHDADQKRLAREDQYLKSIEHDLKDEEMKEILRFKGEPKGPRLGGIDV